MAGTWRKLAPEAEGVLGHRKWSVAAFLAGRLAISGVTWAAESYADDRISSSVAPWLAY